MKRQSVLDAMKSIQQRAEFVPCGKLILDIIQCACVCFRFNLNGPDVEVIRDACNCTTGFYDE